MADGSHEVIVVNRAEPLDITVRADECLKMIGILKNQGGIRQVKYRWLYSIYSSYFNHHSKQIPQNNYLKLWNDYLFAETIVAFEKLENYIYSGVIENTGDDPVTEIYKRAEAIRRKFKKVSLTDDGTVPRDASIRAKLDWLDGYAETHPGEKISHIVEALFPGLSPEDVFSSLVSVPTVPPSLWKDHPPKDTPPDFIKRHYGEYLGRGISRADIRRLDPQLYTALSNWLKTNTLPNDFGLPTVKEKNDHWIDRVTSAGAKGVLDAMGSDDARRLLAAMNRRQKG